MKFDLPVVSPHASALPLPGVIIISSVVIFAQHGQVRRVRLAAILMGVYVVDLAPIGRYAAVRPRADQVFRSRQDALLEGRETRLVKIDPSGGRVEQTSVDSVTESTGNCRVDDFRASHGGSVGDTDDDFVTVAADDLRGLIQPDSKNRAVDWFR